MTEDHESELQYERGKNEQYMRVFEQGEDARRRNVSKNTSLPSNSRFVDPYVGGVKKGPPTQPLIGRVALNQADPDLGKSFYIGSGYLEAVGMVVVKWLAPMARLFYQGVDASVDIADHLIARRTFLQRLDDIVDFEDAVEPEVEGIPLIASRDVVGISGVIPGGVR